MRTQPFSIRLSAKADALVNEEARRTYRSKSAVVEALAEEALRMRLFPGIAFRGVDWERRPWIIGTALDVWEVLQAYRDFAGDAVRTVEESDLTEQQINLAVSYHQRFPEEIDEAVAQNRRSLSELRQHYPSFQVLSPQ